jgi:ketosteroid isomerase-like protein
MNQAFRRLSKALLLVVFALPWRAASPPEDAASSLERLERELVRAIGRTDLATYDRIVADDYVVFDPSGKQLSKAEVMTSYRSGTRGYSGLEIYDVQARVFGDAAVVCAKTKGFRREGDRDVPNRVRYIRVYARRAGRWQAVTQMSAPLPSESDGENSAPKQLP